MCCCCCCCSALFLLCVCCLCFFAASVFSLLFSCFCSYCCCLGCCLGCCSAALRSLCLLGLLLAFCAALLPRSQLGWGGSRRCYSSSALRSRLYTCTCVIQVPSLKLKAAPKGYATSYQRLSIKRTKRRLRPLKALRLVESRQAVPAYAFLPSDGSLCLCPP